MPYHPDKRRKSVPIPFPPCLPKNRDSAQEDSYALDPRIGGHDIKIVANSHERNEVKQPEYVSDIDSQIYGAKAKEDGNKGQLHGDELCALILRSYFLFHEAHAKTPGRSPPSLSSPR